MSGNTEVFVMIRSDCPNDPLVCACSLFMEMKNPDTGEIERWIECENEVPCVINPKDWLQFYCPDSKFP